MIISTSHNFVFTRIPKTGSTSAYRMLHEFHDQSTIHESKISRHTSINQLNDISNIYTDYKSCCFVRNTWERLLSSHAHLATRTGCRVSFDFHRWVMTLTSENIHEHILTRPQHTFINESSRVFRYEEYDQQMYEMFEYLELPRPLSILHTNRTPQQFTINRKYLLDEESIEHIGELYSHEINKFDYSPPDVSTR